MYKEIIIGEKLGHYLCDIIHSFIINTKRKNK